MTKKSKLDSIFDSLRARGWEPGAAAGWDQEMVDRRYGFLAEQQLKGENLALAAVATELLFKHKPDTVRGVMYSVVSAGWLPDTGKKSYGRIQRLLNNLRKKGAIPFNWIVDNVRSTIKPSSWSGIEDYADTVADCYRKDFWASLPEYVALIVEKDTVAGRVAPVTKEFDVSLHPLRGYSSTSFAWSIARELECIDKPVTIYYIGDHDPSGRDIERSVITSLKAYGNDIEFEWQRLAVRPEQFDQYQIIPLEPKQKDVRYAKFVEQYGERCAEVEAVPATDLREMVRDAILAHIPADDWARLQQIEQQERQTWAGFMDHLQRQAG
jgi:hypothetical protein